MKYEVLVNETVYFVCATKREADMRCFLLWHSYLSSIYPKEVFIVREINA